MQVEKIGVTMVYDAIHLKTLFELLGDIFWMHVLSNSYTVFHCQTIWDKQYFIFQWTVNDTILL